MNPNSNGVATDFPSRIYYYVNKQCNLQCDYCYIKADTLKNELDISLIQDFIAFIKDKGVELRITGGEPTLHSRFVDIVELLSQNKINFYLHSNGLWSGAVLDYLLSKKNINLIVSPKLYEIDGNATVYHKILSNLHKLKTNRSAYIAINLVVSKKNIAFMKNLFEDLKNIGVHKISFIPLYPVVRNQTELTNVLQGYNENAEFVKLVESMTHKPHYDGVCLAGIEWCNVEYDNEMKGYAMYACSFVDEVYDRSNANPFLAGRVAYDRLQEMTSLWTNKASWRLFRENDAGKCVLMKNILNPVSGERP